MNKLNNAYIFCSIILLVASVCNYHTTLNRIQYYLYGIFALWSIFAAFKTARLPEGYGLKLIAFLIICSLTALVSPYVTSERFYLIGLFFTILPFVHFIISYEFTFDERSIIKFMHIITLVVVIINVIAFIETFILHSVYLRTGLINSTIFWYQYVVSLNSLVIILCLTLHKLTQKKQYKYYILILATASILSIQLKTYISIIIIILLHTLMYDNKSFIIKVGKWIGVMAILFGVLLQIPAINNKINTYTEIYAIDNEGIARPELYRASVNMAKDHFPMGTGQGTFGSIPVNMYNSRVYYDYGLSHVWGLSNSDEVNFKQDVFWASILGENGVLGIIIYISILLYPVIRITKKRKKNWDYYFLIVSSYIVIITESIVLNLMVRLAFIIIYSGLFAIIIRKIDDNERKLKIHNR